MPDQTTLDAVLAQKKRESAFTELGSIVVRIDKHDIRARTRLWDRMSARARPIGRTGVSFLREVATQSHPGGSY